MSRGPYHAHNGHVYDAVATAWTRSGSVAAARAAKQAGLAVTAAQLETLTAAIAKANGTRKTRLLEPAQVLDAIAAAVVADSGIGIVHGGEANDGTQRTTLCLAYREGSRISVGVGLSRARGAGPGVTWPVLQPWSRTTPARNVDKLRQWAKTIGVSFTLTRLPAQPAPNDEHALLAAVLADPADDGPRAVYADRLIERGEPRGDFIALQLALAKTRPGSARHAELVGATGTLEKQHRVAWSRELAQLTLKQTYDRGFVSSVVIRARAFVADGDRLLALAPIERVRLRELTAPAIRKVAVSPALRRISVLELDGRVGDRLAGELAAGGALANLRGLAVAGCGIGAAAVARLLAVMPKLEWLEIGLTERIAEAVMPFERVSIVSKVKPPGPISLRLAAAGRIRPPP